MFFQGKLNEKIPCTPGNPKNIHAVTKKKFLKGKWKSCASKIPRLPPAYKTSVYSGSKFRSCYCEGIHIFSSYLLFLIINNIPWYSFWCNDFWYACPPELDQPPSIWSKSPVPFHENRSINSFLFRFDFLFYLLLSIELCSVVMGFHYYVCLAGSFLFLPAMGVKLNILLLHYSHLECGTSASAREFLPLFSFALVGLPFQLKVQTTDVKSLNLIPCIGIHLKISSRTWNIHLYTLQSKRFLPFL